MNSKIMPYILPLASIVLISITALLFRPQVTGFFVASPQLNAEIKITADEILPNDAIINIYLEKDNEVVKEISVLSVGEFVNKFSQTGLIYKYGSNHELDYEGFGYTGNQVFTINIDTNGLKSGIYTLKTEIIWHENIISQTEQEVEF